MIYRVGAASLIVGDAVDVLRKLSANRVDAIVTDPPYGLEFMGKSWDTFTGAGMSAPGIGERALGWPSYTGSNTRRCSACGKLVGHGGSPCVCAEPKPTNAIERARLSAFQDWCYLWAVEALRVLKPGGHLLSFGGTRTYHRMTCAIEDAGFEIRDSLHWFYGTGFPKSLNLGDGRGTALKPGHEPIVLARKPPEGTIAANVAKWGTGCLRIDDCRIEGAARDLRGAHQDRPADSASSFDLGSRLAIGTTTLGRWPANVLLDPDAAEELDAQSGDLKGGGAIGAHTAAAALNDRRTVLSPHLAPRGEWVPHGDSGGASRFFFTVKGDLCRKCANGAAEPSQLSATVGASAGSLVQGRSTEPPGSPSAGVIGDQGPSTSETPSASNERSASGTPTIPNTESECSPESQQGKRSPNQCRACGVALNALTATMTTMTGRSRSSESVDAATFGNTSPNGELGARGYASFRYVAKPGGKERDLGCEGLPPKTGGEATERVDGSAGVANPRAGAGRGGGRRNYHPTVKPIDLMRYLCRLVTPIDGTVLDPFTGSGTTGVAALLEGLKFIGIEREPEYAVIADARLRAA